MTVKDIELDKIYKIGDDRYIIRHKAYTKNASTYEMNRPEEYVYVYKFEDGIVSDFMYGRIVDKKEEYDINKVFYLMNHDTEELEEIVITEPLQEISVEEKSKVYGEMLIFNANPSNYGRGKNK